jgi:hypothetical protein
MDILLDMDVETRYSSSSSGTSVKSSPFSWNWGSHMSDCEESSGLQCHVTRTEPNEMSGSVRVTGCCSPDHTLHNCFLTLRNNLHFVGI